MAFSSLGMAPSRWAFSAPCSSPGKLTCFAAGLGAPASPIAGQPWVHYQEKSRLARQRPCQGAGQPAEDALPGQKLSSQLTLPRKPRQARRFSARWGGPDRPKASRPTDLGSPAEPEASQLAWEPWPCQYPTNQGDPSRKKASWSARDPARQ